MLENFGSIRLSINAPTSDLKLLIGEERVISAIKVKDCRSLDELKGEFHVTNLRIMWFVPKFKQRNIIIPFEIITDVSILRSSAVSSKRKILRIKAKTSRKNYVFNFSVHDKNQILYKTLKSAVANYDDSFLFRNVTIRTYLTTDKSLNLLKEEYILKEYIGVYNMTSTSGKTGTMFLTNMRFVWTSEVVENINASVPLIVLNHIDIEENELYGSFFVIPINVKKGTVCKFSYPNKEILREIIETLNKCIDSVKRCPKLTYTTEIPQISHKRHTREHSIKEAFIIEEEDPLLRYEVDNQENVEKDSIIFEEFLGLSVEKSKGIKKISAMWNDI